MSDLKCKDCVLLPPAGRPYNIDISIIGCLYVQKVIFLISSGDIKLLNLCKAGISLEKCCEVA